MASTSRRWKIQSAAAVLLVLVLFGSAIAVRECIQPLRMHSKKPVCEVPVIATTFCHAETCKDGVVAENTFDACTMVAHGLLLVEFDVSDVVLLPAASCQAEMPAGDWTFEDAMRVLPVNEELISMEVSGKELVSLIKHGLGQYHYKGNSSAYPKAAGIRFHVNMKEVKDRSPLLNVEILSMERCQWDALVPEKKYYVLTVRSLAEGQYGHRMLQVGANIDNADPGTHQSTGLHLTQIFWQYAQNVCIIRDPFDNPVPSDTPLQQRLIRLVGEGRQHNQSTATMLY